MRKIFVGLTGGIGTGKSTALACFAKKGAATISLDDVAHRLSRKNGPIHRAILKNFGRKFVRPDGEIDRLSLAALVFNSAVSRRKLERATHPLILREMRLWMKKASKPVVVVDVPLLFEVNAQKNFDLSVLVAAADKAALDRASRRDRASRGQIMARMRAQMPIAQKKNLADVVISNDGSRKQLEKTVDEYYRAFELIAGRGIIARHRGQGRTTSSRGAKSAVRN